MGVKPAAAANVLADILEAAPESDPLGWDAFSGQICGMRETSELAPDAFAVATGIEVAGQFVPFVPGVDRAWLDAVGCELVTFAIDSVDPEELRGLMGKAEAASIARQQGNERAAKAASQDQPASDATAANKGKKGKQPPAMKLHAQPAVGQ